MSEILQALAASAIYKLDAKTRFRPTARPYPTEMDRRIHQFVAPYDSVDLYFRWHKDDYPGFLKKGFEPRQAWMIVHFMHPMSDGLSLPNWPILGPLRNKVLGHGNPRGYAINLYLLNFRGKDQSLGWMNVGDDGSSERAIYYNRGSRFGRVDQRQSEVEDLLMLNGLLDSAQLLNWI